MRSHVAELLRGVCEAIVYALEAQNACEGISECGGIRAQAPCYSQGVPGSIH